MRLTDTQDRVSDFFSMLCAGNKLQGDCKGLWCQVSDIVPVGRLPNLDSKARLHVDECDCRCMADRLMLIFIVIFSLSLSLSLLPSLPPSLLLYLLKSPLLLLRVRRAQRKKRKRKRGKQGRRKRMRMHLRFKLTSERIWLGTPDVAKNWTASGPVTTPG